MRICLGVIAALALGAASGQTTIAVTANPLDDLLVAPESRAVATVLPANRSRLAAQVGAVVESIHVEVGEAVARDQLLVTLEDRDYQQALRRARAGLAAVEARIAQAELRLKRARELSRNRHISEDDLLARETDLAVLEAERNAQAVAVDEASINLERTRIRAPFDGEVVDREAQVGAYVLPGSSLLTVVQTDRSEVEAELATGQAESLRDAEAPVFVSDGREWPVVLARMGSVVDPSQRIRVARLTFPGPAAPVGSSGELRWRAAKARLPADLMVRREGEIGIFVVEAGTARFVPLPDAQEGRPADVDLPGDLLVIVGGRNRVNGGDPVTVAE